MESPFYTYEVNEQGYGSVTGGFVYRGNNLSEHYGRYIFSDFVFGEIWSLNLSDNTDIKSIFNSSSSTFPSMLGNKDIIFSSNLRVTTFASDINDELYLADINEGIFMLNEIGRAHV